MSRQFIVIFGINFMDKSTFKIHSEQDIIDIAYECSSDIFGESDYENMTLDNAVAYLQATTDTVVKELVDFKFDII